LLKPCSPQLLINVVGEALRREGDAEGMRLGL
jgi:hypothetical protein